jgi:hypothetical protein
MHRIFEPGRAKAQIEGRAIAEIVPVEVQHEHLVDLFAG